MTPRQEAFCLAYAKSGNATQAYKEAGYDVKDDNSANAAGNRLLAKVSIQARIKELSAEIAKPKIMDIAEIQEFLSAVARGELKDTYVLQSGVTLEKPVTMTVRTKAADQLAKMQGAYLERREVNMSGGVVVITDDITDTGGDDGESEAE